MLCLPAVLLILQAAARDVEKLPYEVQLGCYTISTHPVKAAIERQMKDLRQELLASLRRKVRNDMCEQRYDFWTSITSLMDQTLMHVGTCVYGGLLQIADSLHKQVVLPIKAVAACTGVANITMECDMLILTP